MRRVELVGWLHFVTVACAPSRASTEMRMLPGPLWFWDGTVDTRYIASRSPSNKTTRNVMEYTHHRRTDVSVQVRNYCVLFEGPELTIANGNGWCV
jgi:hypothetical protein